MNSFSDVVELLAEINPTSDDPINSACPIGKHPYHSFIIIAYDGRTVANLKKL